MTVKKKVVKKPAVNNRDFVPTKAELEELSNWHKSRLDRAFDIGERLNKWKELVPGKWTEFREKWIDPIMSQSSSNRYMRLATNKAKLVKLTNLKTMSLGEALSAAESHKPKKGARGKPPTKKASKASNGSKAAEGAREQLEEMLGAAKGSPNNVTQFPETKLDAATFREELNALIKRYVGRISRNSMAEIMESVVKNIREGKKVA